MIYEVVIGLEVHVQLSTKSKIFCGCSTKFGGEPNSQACPVCLGLPGVLPVLNKKVVEYALRTALALDCRIAPFCRFARKNYYYPDLPKNYQISQYDEPLSSGGYIEIKVKGKVKKIGITRVHLEEDAGKLIHGEELESADSSFVDYNRTGVPLMEVVSEPDISTSEEAHAYLLALKSILQYIEVSDCNMEEGSLRCDANISLRPKGEKEFGTKAELKNMNSFKGVKEALDYEVARQSKVLAEGKEIVQETRLWEVKKGISISMRSKEEAQDYRYFPEPDLVPLTIGKEWVAKIKESLPELPEARERRFISQYKIPEYDAGILTSSKSLADYFEECARLYPKPKVASNWIMGELLGNLKVSNREIEDCPVTPGHLAEMLKLIDKGTISGKIAKEVFAEMFKTGKRAEEIVREKGLTQITSEEEISEVVEKIIKENPKAVEEYREGKEKALGHLVGQVMRLTRGKANPQLANKLLKERLKG
jgi:aspartyl-tRNA(Asn)/glutamyl-tRNA(Gln) amidotransferase subunit B